MSAFLNALREEGTKEDCLVQIARLLDERDKARNKALS
jgi:trans-2-enoyl-CoA reductase